MPRYDVNGELIEETPRTSYGMRGRRMRPVEDRLRDPNSGVRAQAAQQVQERPRYDASGELISPNAPMATLPTRSIPARQDVVQTLPEPEGPWYRQAATHVGRFLSGDGQREEGVGEIAYQSVPEQEDVRWEGGPLSPALNALPREARAWLDAQGRANAIGAGFFLDPNEEHRAEIIRTQVPTSQFRRDEYGNLQVRFDETTPWAYINRPGLSLEDGQTMANEIMRYLAVRRFLPGGGSAAAGITSPLLTSTVREMAAGAISMAAGQGGATVVGGPGVDPVDVAVSAAGAGAGNIAGHALMRAPGAARATIDWIADRLPGGAQRVAERQAAAQQFMRAMEDAARRNAADAVRAGAQQANLAGESLERAIREAEESAVQIVREQAEGRSSELATLAQSFGVRLTRSQLEGDISGQLFIFEAAGDQHGPAAARAARAFLADQNRALPQGIRAIVPNPAGVSSPYAAVNVARGGVERAFQGARDTERQAWGAFGDAVRNSDQPQTSTGAVDRVRGEIIARLEESDVFIVPRTQSEAAQGVANAARQSFPLVHRAMDMIDNLGPATLDDVPLADVQRVLQIKRFIDDLWDASADNPAQRRLLSQMGATVRDWLGRDGMGLARQEPALAEALQRALGISRDLNQTFRNSPIIRSIVEPPPNTQPPTDDEIARQLFGGGSGGLNVGSDGVQALTALRTALGIRSPEWESLRQAAIQRLTQGLDTAVETNQTPAIITTYNRFRDAFSANREAMELLFTPDELTRLRQAQEILRSMMPTPRNPANPTNSGMVAGRAIRGGLQALASTLRGIPGPNIVIGGAQDVAAAARVNIETAGPATESARIARALGSLWSVERNVGGASGALGSAYENWDSAGDRAAEAGDPNAAPVPQEQRDGLPDSTRSAANLNPIVIEENGRFYVIPSVINGQQITPENARNRWFAGVNPALRGPMASREQAEFYARSPRGPRMNRAGRPITLEIGGVTTTVLQATDGKFYIGDQPFNTFEEAEAFLRANMGRPTR